MAVAPDQLSLAIGKRGQNVRLASKLTSWRISIDHNKNAAPVSFAEQRATAIKTLAETLDVGEDVATTLVSNGFLTPEGVNAADIPYLQEVTKLDAETVQKIASAAQAIVGKEETTETTGE